MWMTNIYVRLDIYILYSDPWMHRDKRRNQENFDRTTNYMKIITKHIQVALNKSRYKIYKCHIKIYYCSYNKRSYSWWRHPIETKGLLALCAGNYPVTGEFPLQRPVTQSFGVFFELRLNKRLSKQSLGWWFETLSYSLWRHCNVCTIFSLTLEVRGIICSNPSSLPNQRNINYERKLIHTARSMG